MPHDSQIEPGTPTGLVPAFELLHRGIQQKLWDLQWAELRKLQADCIRAVLAGDGHIVLTAATASGKTEAAFLPVLSRIADPPGGSVRALYIGPLKALINDQFRRVHELCDHLNVPVYHWHGDVPASKKKQLIERPAGVLLTTPESLESLFVNRSAYMGRLFSGLSFVVIDELHSFLRDARGLHLRSLLSRLNAFVSDGQPRVIGLSATLGDPRLAQEFISPDALATVRFIEGEVGEKELRLRLHGYTIRPSQDEEEPPHLLQLAGDLLEHCHGATNLVFANAKAQVEELADLCGRLGAAQGCPEQFMVHHGSLAAGVRSQVEAALKSGRTNVTAFCSSTLEMGIDIGSVKMVGQVGAPWSVASLKQRVGRSGRRDGEPRILRMYVCCDAPTADATIFNRLQLELVQAVAITELMLSGWVEADTPGRCDLSTLSQQIISVICQTGGLNAADLFHRLCVLGPFRRIEKPLFARVLRQLAAKDVLEQMPQGDLILGLKGEQIRKDRGFYAVFPTPEEYTVLFGAEQIGVVTTAINPGEHLLLAGRRWKVTAVDEERLVLLVQPARGWKPPPFSGGGGAIHPIVRQAMRRVLGTTTRYSYLDAEASRILEQARRTAQDANLTSANLVAMGSDKTALMTWTGSRIQDTLRAMFSTRMTEPADEQVALVFDCRPEPLVREARRLLDSSFDPGSLAKAVKNTARKKYDWLLDDGLLHECIARDTLNVNQAKVVLRQVLTALPS